MADSKKRYRAHGLVLRQPAAKLAEELEKKLNELVEEGYEVQLLQLPTSLVILGNRGGEESPLKRLLRSIHVKAEPEEDDEPGMPERLRSLINEVASRAKTTDFTEMIAEVPAVMPAVMKGAPLHLMREIAKECEEFANKHDATHEHDAGGCKMSALLRAIAKEMRKHAMLQVQ